MENIGIMSERLSLRMENRLPELDRLRSEVESFLERSGVGGRESYHIQLALDELVTNVVCYAYNSQGDGEILLEIIRAPDFVDMTLMDWGKPFDPLSAPEPNVALPAEKRRIGGLGIHFVRKTMDVLSYERKDGKNILHIRKMTP